MYSIESDEKNRFPAHGKVTFNILEGNIFHYTCEGPFNEEAVDAISRLLMAVVQEHPGRREIIEMTHSCLGIPDFYSRFDSVVAEFSRKNLQATCTACVVAGHVEGLELTIPHFRATYAKAGVPFEHFSAMQTAIEWVNEFPASD